MPRMAPSNVHRPLPQSWSSPSPQTIAHYNGTLQWHHVLLQSWLSPSPRNDSALQWHLAMAPSNGTQQWHHVHSPKVGRHPLPPTVAHYNGTLRWHSHGTTSSAPCSGTLVPRPIRQSGSSPSPPIGSKNPYSYRYLGKKNATTKHISSTIFSKLCHGPLLWLSSTGPNAAKIQGQCATQ